MLEKVLIANRGEIAVRVMRTCREMGIATVAVYSELDRDALHVRLADEAYALGGPSAAESYLNTEAILDVLDALRRRRACTRATASSPRTPTSRAPSPARGVTFIGPPPEAIEVMGDKISSRLAAEAAGVAGVPGRSETLHGAERGRRLRRGSRLARRHQGGLRRRRSRHEGRARAATRPPAALESAQREAQSYFGRPECYVERYLTWPRHIEMQVLADAHGTTLWLGERDCSAQRRHQKLIEESPAPNFPDDVRARDGRGRGATSRGPAATSTPAPSSSSTRTASSTSSR